MKRIICVMLTLIMLVSLVPAGAVTASAATRATSGKAITVLKEMLKFRKTCYQVQGTNEYRIGYGSICNKSHKNEGPHTINETTASNMLAQEMKKMDSKVNSFATDNKLDLKQRQFDALSVFSYLTGTAWMSGTGNVKTAVKNNAGSTELMNAFNAVLDDSNRAKILTNMYMNGIYSNSVSDSYSQVTYDPNGGDMPLEGSGVQLARSSSGYTMDFDASKSVSHPVTPTKNGAKFIGWYFVGDDANKSSVGRSTALDSSCKNKVLRALWQRNDTTVDNASSDAANVYYTVATSKLPSKSLYEKPGTGKWDQTTADLTNKEKVLVTKEYLATDGSRWGLIDSDPYNDRTMWVLLSGKPGSGSSSGGGSSRTGVNVTNSYVNVRKDANIYSAKTGTLKLNDRVYVSRTEQANGFLWGKAYESRSADEPLGWIALMYTDYNKAKDEEDEEDSSSDSKPSNTVIAKATITYNGYVNLRDNPGTGNKIVGSLAKNEIVNVYEIRTVNGQQWGRISGGWFCMTYSSVQMLSGSSDISNTGSKDYTFTATVSAAGKLDVFVDATENSNYVDETNAPKNGSTVTVHTLRVRGDELWAKIGWTYKDAKNKNVTKYGWVHVGNKDDGLNGSGDNLSLNAVKFTVVADSVNARQGHNTASGIVTKLNKGYEFLVTKIVLDGEDTWGYTMLTLNGDTEQQGWVNLASKYAKRSDRVGKDDSSDSSESTQEVATIVGADVVNVRDGSKISANLVGQLNRGTRANVIKERDGWYKLDVDVDNNPDTSSWVFGDYVEIKEGSTNTDSYSRGKGVVANTYAGVNVRKGPGTAYALVGNKLLPGTQVEILETKYVGTTRWGRCDKGWVCMDYITMLNEEEIVPETTKPDAPNGGEWVDDYDEVDRTTTTAVYTGKANAETVKVWANTEHHEDNDTTHLVRTLHKGDPVTIYELIAVVEKVDVTGEDVDDAGNGLVEKTVTHFWARTNDGYIVDPQNNIELDALDEKAHTLTGSDTLNVRKSADVNSESLGKLKKGDVVKVTALQITQDKVWGRIEYTEDDVYVEDGWIRLDYMAEGALYEEPEETTSPTTKPTQPSDNNNNSNGDTGKSDGTYRYDGKVIGTEELKVRAQATTNSTEVTKLKKGTKVYIYETTIGDGMAWGRCDAGWVYLYYIDMTPRDTTYVDARVVYRSTPIYSDANRTEQVGSYNAMATIDIYEIVGNMARTGLGWVYTGDLL